jgi:hypothetical protein
MRPFRVVPKGGLEPPRAYAHNALNVACLPIPPLWRGSPRRDLPGDTVIVLYRCPRCQAVKPLGAACFALLVQHSLETDDQLVNGPVRAAFRRMLFVADRDERVRLERLIQS